MGIRHGYIGLILSKPFEWIMRLSYGIHLYFNGNSLWYCLTQDELEGICEESIKDDVYTLVKKYKEKETDEKIQS